MTIRDLMDELEQMAEDIGEDTEVKIAYQPNHPLQSEIGFTTEFEGTVYLCESGHPNNAPRSLWYDR